jgi:hypothetical protein
METKPCGNCGFDEIGVGVSLPKEIGDPIMVFAKCNNCKNTSEEMPIRTTIGDLIRVWNNGAAYKPLRPHTFSPGSDSWRTK